MKFQDRTNFQKRYGYNLITFKIFGNELSIHRKVQLDINHEILPTLCCHINNKRIFAIFAKNSKYVGNIKV